MSATHVTSDKAVESIGQQNSAQIAELLKQLNSAKEKQERVASQKLESKTEAKERLALSLFVTHNISVKIQTINTFLMK